MYSNDRFIQIWIKKGAFLWDRFSDGTIRQVAAALHLTMIFRAGCCGQWPDDCICPECEIFGTPGDPLCYITHGMRRTEEQKFLLEIEKRKWREAFERAKAHEEMLSLLPMEWPWDDDSKSLIESKANDGDWRDDYID